MKLTEVQWRSLNWFADGHHRSAYNARSRLDTLEALYRRGLLSRRGGLGSTAFPHTSIKWYITPAGRAALEERGDG